MQQPGPWSVRGTLYGCARYGCVYYTYAEFDIGMAALTRRSDGRREQRFRAPLHSATAASLAILATHSLLLTPSLAGEKRGLTADPRSRRAAPLVLKETRLAVATNVRGEAATITTVWC